MLTDIGTSITYSLIDGRQPHAQRTVTTPLTQSQLTSLERDGYLALPSAIDPERRARLGAAIDQLAERVDAGMVPSHAPGEEFYRDLMLHDERFVELMTDPLLVNTARTMLGAHVRLRSMTCRDNRPSSAGNRGIGWHIHQRGASEPRPRWFSPLQGLDCLHYLDASNADSGPTAVIPGSHRNPQIDLAHDQADHPDQRILELPAGSLLLMHPNLYHRGLPATGATPRRRLLIVSFVPSWYRWSPHDRHDHGPWIQTMATRWRDDPEQLELLGIGGYT